jgi:hypothetical protein
MKKFYILIVLSLVLVLFSNNCSAQEFKGNASGTFGIYNIKIRLQYELLLKNRASTGMNMNYYLVNWTGPVFEPFIRIYGRKNGNVKGFFGQFKLIYGNLSTLDELYKDKVANKRWSTCGFGINCGYKFLLGNHFTIEPLIGFRLLSQPVYRFNAGISEADREDIRVGYQYDWWFTTGGPLDFQLKFGAQF